MVRQVAFNRDIRAPTVTLEGDIFQPSGLLTGGSRKYVILSIIPLDLFGVYVLDFIQIWFSSPKKLTKNIVYFVFFCLRGGGELLRQLHDLAEAETKLQVHQKRLYEIEAKVNFFQILSLAITFLLEKAKVGLAAELDTIEYQYGSKHKAYTSSTV